jgi:NAD(P)-dependent dehydrogenase (short-subunit alcohol dehydrogenase family)
MGRLRLFQAGCEKVFVVSRKADACQAAAALLNKLPQKLESSRAIPLAFDLSKVEEIDKLVSEISAVTQHVDILFANAGASWGASFENQPEHAFTKIMDLNVKSIFYTVQRLQPLLRRRATIGNPSTVIINSSAAGIGVGTLGEHGTHAYSVSKAAAIHLARVLAVELGPRGINTNAICPGFFPTKMSAGLISLEGGLALQAARSPNGRLGMPEDIAGLVVFLVSRAASHINGAVISIDGGAHLGNGKL